MSKTHDDGWSENNQQTTSMVVAESDAYLLPRSHIEDLMGVSEKIGQWFFENLHDDKVACTDLSEHGFYPEERRVIFHFLIASLPDVVGIKCNGKVVIGKSDEEIAEFLDIDVEEIEDDLVNEEEAEEEMRGETDTVSESQIELMEELAEVVSKTRRGGFATIVESDLTDEEVMPILRCIQIAVYHDYGEQIYIGFTDIGPVMTSNIEKLADSTHMSEYELEQQLEGFEGDL
jgi:hypothetical protein